MEESYSVLARRYDALMSDINYAGYADFYENTINEYAPSAPKKLVDLGCGTGSITVLMAKRGFEVCGIDLSFEMLAAAQKKASDGHLKIIFAEQDMRYLDCGGGYGAAVCSFDGMNYLTDAGAFAECASRVYSSLVPGGMFIFDLNTKYKYEHIISGNSFVYELDDMMLVWQNYYKKSSGVCDYYLTFFEKEGKSWRRTDEYQSQRCFSERSVRKTLGEAGFDIIKTVSDINGSPVTGSSERIFYICRRKQEK